MLGFNDIDRVQMADVASPSRGGYLPGMYYTCGSSNGATTSSTLGNGTLRVRKWRVTQRVKIAKMGLRVSGAGDAGSTLRIAVFLDGRGAANNVPGYPGNLLWDSGTYGTLAGDAIGTPEVTINDYLDPGLYFVGAVVQGVTTTQPTVETAAGPLDLDPLPFGTTFPAALTAASLGFAYLGVTGAIPAAFTPTFNLSSVMPRVFFKTG